MRERRYTLLPLLLKSLARGDRQGQAIMEKKLLSFLLH